MPPHTFMYKLPYDQLIGIDARSSRRNRFFHEFRTVKFVAFNFSNSYIQYIHCEK